MVVDSPGTCNPNPRVETHLPHPIVHNWGNVGIMEKKMETTIVYGGNIGIMENKMETTIMENQMEKKMENEMETLLLGFFLPACLDPLSLR